MFKKIFFFLLITVSITFLIENLINSKQLLIKHDIYHHDFAANYSGDKVWGNNTYRVCTDSSGFKINCKDFNKLRLIKCKSRLIRGATFFVYQNFIIAKRILLFLHIKLSIMKSIIFIRCVSLSSLLFAQSDC